MNYEQYGETFDRDGYLIIRKFLPYDEFAELNENLDRYIREIVPTLPDTHAFYENRNRPETLKQMQFMAKDRYFSQYRHHPRWTACAEALLSEPVDALEPEWFNKPPASEHPTPPHQDNHYFCLKPANALTMWLALDAIDQENGCLRYVRGAHKHGVRPHAVTQVIGFSQGITDYGREDEVREVVISANPNDLLIHHCQMIHRAEANRSATRSRRAFAIVFRGASSRLDKEAEARYTAGRKTQHQAHRLQTE